MKYTVTLLTPGNQTCFIRNVPIKDHVNHGFNYDSLWYCKSRALLVYIQYTFSYVQRRGRNIANGRQFSVYCIKEICTNAQQTSTAYGLTH